MDDAMIDEQLAAIAAFKTDGANQGILEVARAAASGLVKCLPPEARGCSVICQSQSRGGGITATLHLEVLVTPKMLKKA